MKIVPIVLLLIAARGMAGSWSPASAQPIGIVPTVALMGGSITFTIAPFTGRISIGDHTATTKVL